MPRRKNKKFEPEEWQHNPDYKNKAGYENRAYFMVFESLLMSDAYLSLNSGERELLTVCLAQERFGRADEKRGFSEKYRNDRRYFTMNKQKREMYHLSSNATTASKQMEALITHGFVDCVVNGQNTRSKSLYRLSSRWILYGTEAFSVPEDVKTTAMRNRERKAAAKSEARAP